MKKAAGLFGGLLLYISLSPLPIVADPSPLAPPLRIAVDQMMGYQAPWAAGRGLQPGGAPGLRPLRVEEYVRTGTGGLPACAPTASQWSVGLPPYKSAVPRPLGLCLAPYLVLRAARVFRTMAATMHRAPVIRLGVMVSPSRSTPRTMEVRGWRG